jgi:phage baseplate assembly protein W
MATTSVLSGISFPFRKQNNGLPARDVGVDVIRSDLILLLRTRKRTRVMQPNIGTNLHLLIFEDQGPILQSLISREIVTSIAAQLPMVNVLNITFQVDNDNQKLTYVNVQYSVQGIVDETGYVELPQSAAA